MTTDKKNALRYAEKLARYAFIYLAAAIFCALFGAVYEKFSHDVFSYYMIYAFAIPLVLGTFPLLWIALQTWRRIRESAKNARFLGYGSDQEEYGIFTQEAGGGIEIDPAGSGQRSLMETEKLSFHLPGSFELNAWGAGIATLTVGSIFHGVLDIYGTTNKLWIVYPIVGLILLAAGLAAFIIGRATVNHVRRKKIA